MLVPARPSRDSVPPVIRIQSATLASVSSANAPDGSAKLRSAARRRSFQPSRSNCHKPPGENSLKASSVRRFVHGSFWSTTRNAPRLQIPARRLIARTGTPSSRQSRSAVSYPAANTCAPVSILNPSTSSTAMRPPARSAASSTVNSKPRLRSA